jgi:glycosyltransferase involved in cell wall biosynthesis
MRSRDSDRGAGLIVAVFARSDQVGGAERSTIELAAEDQVQGGRWLAIVRDTGDGPLVPLCAELGVPVVTVRGMIDAVRRLRRARPSAIWTFGLRWSISLRWLACTGLVRDLSGRRSLMLVAQRGLETWRRPWHNWLDRSTQRLVDAYVANSVAAGEMLIASVGIDRSRVVTIRSGVSAAWLTAPSRVRVAPSTVARIIMVGNNRAEKAFEDAFRILSLVDRERWVATVFSNDLDGLPELVRAAGIEGRTTVIVGHRLTMDDYDRADVLLHAARSESLPRAVLEAVARKVAVVASDVGDVAALVNPSSLFRPGDIDGGVDALCRAIAAPAGSRSPPESTSALRSEATVAAELRALLSSLS